MQPWTGELSRADAARVLAQVPARRRAALGGWDCSSAQSFCGGPGRQFRVGAFSASAVEASFDPFRTTNIVCGAAAHRAGPPTSSELLLREFLEELRNVHRRDCPELVHVNTVIMMRDQVAKIDDVSPRHVGILRAVLLGECVRCFSDDLQQSLCGSLSGPVRIERWAPVCDEFAEMLRCLHDVSDAQFISATQIGTASLRM